MKITWNLAGFEELRTEPAIMDELERIGQEVADRAGPGFEVKGPEHTGGRGRGRVAVVTATEQAKFTNAVEGTLLRALGGGA